MRNILVTVLVAGTMLSGCELIAKFDPTLLDGGEGGPIGDAVVGSDAADMAVGNDVVQPPDAAQVDAADVPVGADAPSDSAPQDAAPEAAMEAAVDAGEDATPEAAMESGTNDDVVDAQCVVPDDTMDESDTGVSE